VLAKSSASFHFVRDFNAGNILPEFILLRVLLAMTVGTDIRETN
jgi:hypothetical protein